MEFGTLIFPKPQRAMSDARYAEERGFTHAWFPDSHMICGDVYACMALAALNTSKIKLASGVAIASSRIPPVTVHSIATVNELAPGRVILGYGTGHTGRRLMGLGPVKLAEFREQVRVIRELLDTGEATYRTEGLSRRIRFLHRDRRFINLDDKIPLYLAANGPKALELAGEFGDGLMTGRLTSVERMEVLWRHVEAGARRAGRAVTRLPVVSLTHVCVLRPGEAVDSPRVVEMTGPWVMAALHGVAAGYVRALDVPPQARPVFEAYAEYASRMKTPPAERYLELHRGHVTFLLPEERRFVTAETIRSTTIVGRREEIAEQLAALEKAGLRQVVLAPPMDYFSECIDEVSRELIGRV